MTDEPDAAAAGDQAERAPDATPRPGAGPGMEPPVCDVCGASMYERHCRIICPQCGYQRDCSDP